jgi:hypothetical protein
VSEFIEKAKGSRPGSVYREGVSRARSGRRSGAPRSKQEDEGHVTYMGSIVMGAVDPPSTCRLPQSRSPITGRLRRREKESAERSPDLRQCHRDRSADGRPDLWGHLGTGTGARSRLIAEGGANSFWSGNMGTTHARTNEWVLDDKTAFAGQEKDLMRWERHFRCSSPTDGRGGPLSVNGSGDHAGRRGLQLLVDKQTSCCGDHPGGHDGRRAPRDDEKPTGRALADRSSACRIPSAPTPPASAAVTPDIVRSLIGVGGGGHGRGATTRYGSDEKALAPESVRSRAA